MGGGTRSRRRIRGDLRWSSATADAAARGARRDEKRTGMSVNKKKRGDFNDQRRTVGKGKKSQMSWRTSLAPNLGVVVHGLCWCSMHRRSARGRRRWVVGRLTRGSSTMKEQKSRRIKLVLKGEGGGNILRPYTRGHAAPPPVPRLKSCSLSVFFNRFF